MSTEKSVQNNVIQKQACVKDMKAGDIATICDSTIIGNNKSLVMLDFFGNLILLTNPSGDGWARALGGSIANVKVVIHKKVKFVIEE